MIVSGRQIIDYFYYYSKEIYIL